ncbi:MAG: hypothetical protein IAE97_06905 [Chthoniobacterales bacterium]|nr:hypothetical protein [Chthoniobacterales bacterium]
MSPKSAPTEAERRWQARVDAAKAAVAEAEKAMTATTSPTMQTYLYRELREKQRALQAALRAR